MSVIEPPSLMPLLARRHPTYLMEAHNGISAKVAAEAGFEAIWASGLTISAALGVRDANELSWTQVLGVVEMIVDATGVPVLMDGDSGYGNFNNVRRLVRKLSERGVAGVCLEDKEFPKINSFVEGNQRLADPGEFAGKIRAAKDSQLHSSFCVVARTEALIAGTGLNDALERADTYLRAGADAILIHSKRSDASEVLAFGQAWERRCPLVCVPTTYGDVDANQLGAAGYSLIIWANHSLRASVQAMRTVSKRLLRDGSSVGVDTDIVPISDLLALTNHGELCDAASKYAVDP